MKWIVLIISCLALSGCQAMIYGTATDFNQLTLGMTKSEVVAVLGSPVSVGANADTGEETLVYKRMRHAISDWPRLYLVTLRDGKLIRYGEAPVSPTDGGGGRRLAIEVMPGVWSY